MKDVPGLSEGCSPPWDRDVFLVLSLLDAASYVGVTWEYILRLLRMAQTEDDMLALCHGKGQEGLGKTLFESGREERRANKEAGPSK